MKTTQLPEELILNSKAYFSTQIHDIERFDGVARVVDITGVSMNNAEQIFFEYQVRYYDTLNNNVRLDTFVEKGPEWVITNNTLTSIRDANNQKVPNPNFVPEPDRDPKVEYTANQLEEFIKIPSFNYVKEVILSANTPLKNILNFYIKDDAINSNRFEF